MSAQLSFAVLGAGSYGTALAVLLARNGHNVQLWARNAEHVAEMQQARNNSKYLPDVAFPENLSVTDSVESALADHPIILVAVPSHAFRDTLHLIKPYVDQSSRLVWASKGLDPESGDLLGNVLKSILGSDMPHAILSGPTFAKEMAIGMPTAITLAANNDEFAEQLALALHNERFRVYTSDDIVGVQVGGAVKNVVAIGAGIADGLGYGANARTALITRGLVEMTRLGVAAGGKQETFNGMAGMGDLVLTCTDNQSRNRRFGLALGKGASRDEAEHAIGQVVEGVRNAKEVKMLAKRLNVEMPISDAIYRIIYEGVDARQAAHELLTRDLKSEGIK
ncbi:NAD(P)H-dependent glycerol-3-phosphate dehydrogenase [Kangiella profundi]|uniref:Glycerol-3-phosphate dehydrogenase [NAD(P)+] n=1 Tax=Kangiella profundi TaxID=1561924 RepID=A0A2K9AX35_9GAMM|nr:NAD(P)H-dependent glycerol-3-phosphate dehydrogenase [Kangiella profundi]AUD79691.1 NAD(P)H-dependent glycerol-3-phosphate dehydrogenase [Kangiella profundi]GGE96245.1 glycerol-3-phosphate dehydrogenase [NAD(P)+] [Kangiella profundi]